ncbi:pancreatic lipase-related protein 2 [Nasonia vitripennis]|uniref:phospholipase A1 n=1 Tax=Nasonia vitripennis TaxID=7425 RepID=A0A7M7GE56_NASVI|nr:pancreatic lipase-related protein 2 [Nasonia vitripennis]
MNTLFIALFNVSFFYFVSTKETPVNLSCAELKKKIVGSVMNGFSSKPTYDGTDFYLANKNGEDAIQIGPNGWSGLETDGFDSSRKTCFIIHGFKDHHQRGWIKKLQKGLHNAINYNLIIIDWSKGSESWNYVEAVHNTYKVAQGIVKFLDSMQKEVSILNNFTENESWKNLYFIGHSLGAQIAGQAGHLIKSSSNFKMERITGLDPARPCFQSVDPIFKLDYSDADFVDVIHTQTGNDEDVSGIGVQERSGHVDFYVNGGIIQPECETKLMAIQKMLCSHNLAYRFFTETVYDSKTNNCKLMGYKWDGSYKEALQILDEVDKGNSCADCMEMGINAVNHKIESGRYLVFTSVSRPYCPLKTGDKSLLTKELQKLNATTKLFPNLPSIRKILYGNWFD